MAKIKIYNEIQKTASGSKETTILVEGKNIVDALYDIERINPNLNIAVLDHVCFKEPAPMFLKGYSGIEESLCQNSELYNILTSIDMANFYKYNSKNLNKGLYLNRGFYIEDVKFNNGKTFNIIGATSPNREMQIRYKRFTEIENDEALYSRLDFILSIAAINNVDILVMSSFGCNVYKQDINKVSSFLKELLLNKYKNTFKTVLITDDKIANYNVWKSTF